MRRILPLFLGCSPAPSSPDGSWLGPAEPPAEDSVIGDDSCDLTTPLDAFERYIEPVISDEGPSTCNECHLSGIDLAMYVRATPCQTFACMVEQGVVDLDDPEHSEVLAFIQQANPATSTITEDVVWREYDAFLEWINWNVACFDDACGTIEDPCGAAPTGPIPDGVLDPLEGCDEATLAQGFEDKVWRWHGRCWSCHAAGGEGRDDFPAAPEFYVWAEEDDALSSLLTMYNVLGLDLVDRTDPAASPLLTKPLAEGYAATTALGTVTGVFHGGGDKFPPDEAGELHDRSMPDFVAWVQQVVECQP